MPSIYARSARSGKLYEVSIAGTQPTPEEQAYIEQRIDNIEGFGAVEAPLPTEEVDDASAAGNLITGFGRGFLTSFTELPQGIVGLGESVLGYEPGSTAVGETAQDISKAGRSGVEYILGQSDGSVSSKTGEAFGSLASFLVPGTAAAKGAKLANASLKAQKAAGLTAAGAMGVGLGSSEQINRVASQLSQGKEVSPEDFMSATKLGGLIGLSEIAPFSRILGDTLNILRKVPKGSQEEAIKRISGRLKRMVGTGIAEGSQEAIAGIAQDLVEQNLYNPEANIGATADEEFIYGGGAGAALQFIVDSIRGRQLNKMDTAFTQLKDDLAEESDEAAEKAAFAAKSVQSGETFQGEQKLLPSAKTDEEIEEGSEQEVDSKTKSLGLSPEEEAIASVQAARERTLGLAKVELSALPEDEAAIIRRKRITLGEDPDLDVDLNELQETIGQEAYVREYKKQKPNMWRESGQNPRNQKPFSAVQYEQAVNAVREKGKATIPVIQAAAKVDGKPVPLSVARELQNEMGRKGVLNQTGENKWEVMEEVEPQEDSVTQLRRTYNELERKIDEVRQEKLDAQEKRDAAKNNGDTTVAKTSEQEMAEADRRIDRLNNTRGTVEAQLNELDPDNPVVNSIDNTQQESNRARQVGDAVSEEKITEEYARKRQRVANALRKYLNTIGLGNRVDLVTQNVIFPENTDKEAKFGSLEEQLIKEGVIEGFESAGDNGRRVIGIAMEIYDPNLSEEELALKLRGVMNHEMIHALRGLGLFTDKEWQTLSSAAQNKKRVRYVNGRLQEREYTYYDRAERIYTPIAAEQGLSPDQTIDLIKEEAVAEMFRDYVDGKLKIAGKPQSLLKRIVKFFTSVFRSHNDVGFKEAADIFENITTSDKTKQIGRRPTMSETNFDDANVANDQMRKSSVVFSADRSITAYKVITKGPDDKLYPLFVDAKTEIPMGQWVEAVMPFTFEHKGRLYVPSRGAIGADGKRKAGTGVDIPIPNESVRKQLLKDGYITKTSAKSVKAVAARGGFHAGSLPIANHIGKEPKITSEQRQVLIDNGFERSIKGKEGNFILNIREDDQVWVEVLVPDNSHGVDWQAVANSKAGVYANNPQNRKLGRVGQIIPQQADINDDIPYGGHYLYRQGAARPEESWVISGNMLVNREMSREEVRQINEANGVKDSPTLAELSEIFGPSEARQIVFGKSEKKYSIAPPAPLGGISQFLTDQEMEDLMVGRKNDVQNKAEKIAEIFSQLPSAENFAAVAIAGQAKKGWYRDSAKAIMDIFGVHDARRFTALLAATSPQTSVESNAINTLNIWANWNKAGRPQDQATIFKIMGESVQGDKGEDSILPAWRANSIRALTAPFGQEFGIMVSGPKVNSFMLNLVNELDEVTNDTWMANFALIEQPTFKGAKTVAFQDELGKIGVKGPGYLAFSARVREAARAASEITGDSWMPAEIQETVWSLSKALLEKRKRLKGDMRGMTAKQLLTEGIITDQQVADVPDFARLFTDGVLGRILEDAGYKEQLDAVRSGAGGDGVAVEPRPVYSAENVSANKDFIRRELGDFADRLEILAVNGKKALRKFSTTIPADINGGRRAAINVRIGAGFNGRVFNKQRASGVINGYNVISTYTVSGNAARTYNEQNVSTPRFIELAPSEQSAQQFTDSITTAKASLGQLGESVFVYSPDEYKDMRLFLTEDGTGGFALKETETAGVIDIVSVFNRNAPSEPGAGDGGPHKQLNYPMIRLATEEGGNMLDAFDIYLPKLYSANGFRVRSRLKWDDEQAPDGWSKEAFKDFNNGEPDVVFMYYQPDRIDVYKNNSDEGEMFDDYMEAVNAQIGAALSPTSINRYKDQQIAEENTENNPNEFLTEQDDAQLATVREGINAEEKYDGTKLSITPPKPTTLLRAPLKTKVQYEYGYIQEGNKKLPVVLMYGNHIEEVGGRGSGFGMKHIRERGHVQELIDAGFPSAEKAIFDTMYRWGAQGYRDGAEVIIFPMGDDTVELQYDAGKRGRVILALTKKGVRYNGEPAYTVKTVYPKDKKKKFSVAFSAIDPNRIQNQIPVAQDSLMYSRASNLLAKVLGVAYDRNKAEDIADNFLQKFQDSMLPVGRMIDELKSQGATITDANDTYLREELYHGITGSKIADNEKNLYEPMLNLVKGIGLTEGQVSALRANSRFIREAMQAGKPLKQILADAFLYARHAEERNAYIRSIDPENDSGSGMTDTEARTIKQFFDSLTGTERQRFIDIGVAADRIVQSTNDIRVASGLTPDFNDGEITEDEAGKTVKQALPNYTAYVPLRGILDPQNEASEEYSGRPSSRPKFGARGREDMRMFGRFEFAKDIMANLMVQNQNAIVRSERNRVGKSFLELLRNEPRLTDSYARIISQRPTIRVLSGGVVKTRPDPRFADRDDILIVKEGGQEVAIQIDDPRIALAMKGASGMSAQHAGGLVKVLGKINRYLSNINTSWNPEFLITNMVRDLQTAGVNINQYEMNGLTNDIRKTIVPALAGIKRSIIDNDNTSEWSKIYQEFVQAGGQNATNMMSDLNDQLGRLDEMLKEVSDAGANGLYKQTKAGFGKILKTLEDYNTVVENGVRIATFEALRKRGDFSDDRAAQAARNVTVNFAKGGEYKTFMNSLYLFYNASLQGSFALLNGALRSSKVRKLWVGAMVTGMMLDQLNSYISDDDDDGQEIYDKIPDYVLEKNLILMDPFGVLPSERGYFKIPMPYGLNMAVNMGRSISRAGRGGYSASEATSSFVGTIIDTLNPIGDTPRIPFVDDDFEFQDILTTLSPSVGDPVVQYLTNSDYARKPVYKEPSSFGVPAPESQIHWTTTSPSAIFIANFIRKPFGLGDASDVRPGFVEVSPDTLEFWFDYATGGVGRFVQRTAEFGYSTAPKLMAGEFEEAMLRSTPLFRQVVSSVSEREDIGNFVEKRDRVLLTRKDFIDARKKGDEQRAQRIALAYKEELRISGIVNALNNARNKLIRKRKQIEESKYIPEEQKELLIERMNTRIKEIVTRANSLMSNL